MDNSFFAYLQWLELIAFFSGYPLIFAFVAFTNSSLKQRNILKINLTIYLPFTYALIGSLYFGLQLKKFYPGYSFENIQSTLQHPLLTAWALLSILFWIPAFSKKVIISLLHSLLFLFLLISDFIAQLNVISGDKSMLKNDMKLYGDSLLINLGAFLLILLLGYLFSVLKKRF